ncbi:hypothetical protein Cme02nite_54520 [Catellatospora methionotrophica]|uniref:Uncharacterized protein n=1 Tax=Catellatospora methionotrophica TaxID=121620 RepID=A0A8J3LEY1_9ACTN|nr:hypothetical protein Cme02nite_54520 [Catellatospora methionotrophica]
MWLLSGHVLTLASEVGPAQPPKGPNRGRARHTRLGCGAAAGGASALRTACPAFQSTVTTTLPRARPAST